MSGEVFIASGGGGGNGDSIASVLSQDARTKERLANQKRGVDGTVRENAFTFSSGLPFPILSGRCDGIRIKRRGTTAGAVFRLEDSEGNSFVMRPGDRVRARMNNLSLTRQAASIASGTVTVIFIYGEADYEEPASNGAVVVEISSPTYASAATLATNAGTLTSASGSSIDGARRVAAFVEAPAAQTLSGTGGVWYFFNPISSLWEPVGVAGAGEPLPVSIGRVWSVPAIEIGAGIGRVAFVPDALTSSGAGAITVHTVTME